MTDNDTSAVSNKSSSHQFGKLLIELGPIVVFFVVNSRAGIFWGTGAFMAATIVSLLASRMVFGRVPIMPLVSGAFVLIFGGLTVWLQDDLFIKMKPTIVNFLFSVILFGGLAFGQSLLKYPFGEAFDLTDEGWRKLTVRWAVFFLVLAAINEIVWRGFTTEFWIAFKVWGVMPLTMVFAVSQLGLINTHSNKPL